MGNVLCPHCDKSLHHQTLKFVRAYWITMNDNLSGQTLRVERKEYECPHCKNFVMFVGGRIVKAVSHDL